MPHWAHLTIASATSSVPEFGTSRVESEVEADPDEDCLETVYQRQAK